MPLITLTCSICNKEYRMSSWYKNRLFCSNKCRGVWLKNQGIKPPPRTGASPWNKGLTKKDDKRILKMSRCRFGDKNWQWVHGKSKSHRLAWQSSEHKAWRKAVFERDNYACVLCGSRGELQADHIKCFAHNPDLRFEIGNGRTLCVSCHKQTINFGTHSEELCA